jgi:NAD(P)-dependent dehydrogenase (short-subunit alcohol dehydrogenase family)
LEAIATSDSKKFADDSVALAICHYFLHYEAITAYVSTKFALEGLSESMSYELESFGIESCSDLTWIYQKN